MEEWRCQHIAAIDRHLVSMEPFRPTSPNPDKLEEYLQSLAVYRCMCSEQLPSALRCDVATLTPELFSALQAKVTSLITFRDE